MKKLTLVLLTLIVSFQAHALPIQMTAVTTLLGSDNAGANISIPGTAFGDTITLTVIVDNGGTSLLSQSWGPGDFLSASLDVGTYSALYAAPSYASNGFATDAVGQLTNAFFVHCCSSPIGATTDNFGVGTGRLSQNAFNDNNVNSNFISSGPTSSQYWPSQNVGLWSVAFVADVPAPAVIWLFGIGLLGLVGFTRRRKAA